MKPPYDYDVLVVGGGAAGLAAAIRVRWVKPGSALTSSVCVIEPSQPGGMLRLGECELTGPGWTTAGTEILGRLLGDLEALQIPVLRSRVRAIRRHGLVYHVEMEDGAVLSCLAVVVASGLRPLSNELDYVGRGAHFLASGHENLPTFLEGVAKEAGSRGLVIVGGPKTDLLSAVIERFVEPHCAVTRIQPGALREIQGTPRVEAVRLRSDGGEAESEERTLECGAVLVDTNAFALGPYIDIEGLEAERDERGFVWVDAAMRTTCPGVYAAGAVTGRYATALVALADGVAAGLSAYSYAFHVKLGEWPRLFPLTGVGELLEPRPKRIPDIPPSAIPVALGDAPSWVDGSQSLASLAARMRTHPKALAQALARAIAERRVTFHHIDNPEEE